MVTKTRHIYMGTSRMPILPSCISFAKFLPFFAKYYSPFCLFQVGFAILSNFCKMFQTFAKPVATCLRVVQIVLANTTVVCYLHIMLPNVIQIVAILHKHLCNLAMFCYIIETSLLTRWQIFWHLPQNFSPSSAHFFHPTQKNSKIPPHFYHSIWSSRITKNIPLLQKSLE